MSRYKDLRHSRLAREGGTMPEKKFSSSDKRTRDLRPKNISGGIEPFSMLLWRERTVRSERAPIYDERSKSQR